MAPVESSSMEARSARLYADTFGTPSRHVIMVITRTIGSSALATHELAIFPAHVPTPRAAVYVHVCSRANGILSDEIEMRISEKVFRCEPLTPCELYPRAAFPCLPCLLLPLAEDFPTDAHFWVLGALGERRERD